MNYFEDYFNKIKNSTIVVLDVESTGGNYGNIVTEIAGIQLKNLLIMGKTYQAFFKPIQLEKNNNNNKIDYYNKYCKDYYAESNELIKNFLDFIKNYQILTYNVGYDYHVLNDFLKANDFSQIPKERFQCILQLSRKFTTEYKIKTPHSLSDMCNVLEIEFDKKYGIYHTGFIDAVMASKVLIKINQIITKYEINCEKKYPESKNVVNDDQENFSGINEMTTSFEKMSISGESVDEAKKKDIITSFKIFFKNMEKKNKTNDMNESGTHSEKRSNSFYANSDENNVKSNPPKCPIISNQISNFNRKSGESKEKNDLEKKTFFSEKILNQPVIRYQTFNFKKNDKKLYITKTDEEIFNIIRAFDKNFKFNKFENPKLVKKLNSLECAYIGNIVCGCEGINWQQSAYQVGLFDGKIGIEFSKVNKFNDIKKNINEENFDFSMDELPWAENLSLEIQYVIKENFENLINSLIKNAESLKLI